MTRHWSPEPQWGLLHPGPSPDRLYEGGDCKSRSSGPLCWRIATTVLALGG
jgi:hypothetical protein